MGCTNSMTLEPSVTSVSYNGKRSSISAAEAFAYPPWCLRDVTVDDKVKELIQKSWKTAMRGKSPPFQEAASKNKGLTPLVFFYNSFYDTMFQLAPESKPKFKSGMMVQGRMLAHILGFAVNNLDQSAEMEETLRYLAVQHNRIGVTATDYSTMFVCLTFALKNVLGPDLFTTEVRYAWVCAISRLMQVMLPFVITGQITLDNIRLQEVHDYRSLAQINPEFQYEGSVSRRFSRSRSRSKSAKHPSRLGASATNLILDEDVDE